MAEGKLTALAVKRLTKPGFYNDGAGLYFRIEGGARYWMFRFKLDKKAHWMGLGPERDITLADARTAARECRRMIGQGINPIEARRTEKATRLADIGGKDFETVTDTYIAAKKAGWKNEKHGKQWKATLTAYAFPVFKGTPVGAITVEDVLHCLTPIWEAKPETASRVRGRIENVLDYAKTRGWRTGENPARWKGHLDHLLPARADIARVKHHASLEWSAMPAAMAALTASNTRSAQCLRFIILTAARSGEARAARWNEIDLAKKTWKIPPEKMKAGVEHHVPLSEAAIAVLHAVEPFKKAADGLVFPGGKAGSPLSDVAVSQALASVVAGYTVHGCRGTFRTWAGESTAYPAAVCEAALAHKNENRVEAAYLHTAFFPQRVPLMAEWADYCMSVSTTSL